MLIALVKKKSFNQDFLVSLLVGGASAASVQDYASSWPSPTRPVFPAAQDNLLGELTVALLPSLAPTAGLKLAAGFLGCEARSH